MLAVRVLKPFKRRGEILTPGAVLTIAPESLGKLQGYVEQVNLHQLIGEALADIDQSGRPWGGFFEALSASDRQRLRDAEVEVDDAVLTDDYGRAIEALNTYRGLVMELRRRLH